MPTAAAATVVSALFFSLTLACLLSFKQRKFRVYLLLGLSCLFRGIGYAVRSSNIQSPSDAKAGTYLALASAGYGISLAVICLLHGCWWKNSEAGSHLRRLSVYTRLLIAPVIVLGPLCGVVLAGLIYGDGSPGAMQDADALRKAAGWGMLSILIVLVLISLYASWLAWRAQRAQQCNKGAQQGGKLSIDPDLLVLVLVACCALLLISASFRVASIYHKNLPLSDSTFYSVQVLPELLEVTLLLWPMLMPRVALGRGFQRWWHATHGFAEGCGKAGEAAVAAEGGLVQQPRASSKKLREDDDDEEGAEVQPI